MTTLETERLLLRPYTYADEAAYLEMVQDPEVMRYLPGGAPLSAEAGRAMFQRRLSGDDPNRRHFGLVEKGTGRLVGWAGLMRLAGTSDTEVYYGLRRDAWGQGYATEAARRLVRWAFDELRLPRVVAVVDPANARSNEVLHRLGMRFDHVGRHYERDLNLYVLDAPATAATAPPAPANAPAGLAWPPPPPPATAPIGAPPALPPAAAPVASAYCTRCGAALPGGAAFCPACGQAVAPAIPAPPPAAPAWTGLSPPTEAPASTTRPSGVTFACALSIVWGAFACLSAFFVITFASVAGGYPWPGPPTAALGAFAGAVLAAVGVLGILAGTQGLQGRAWTRPALLVLFAVGALVAVATVVVPILNVIAIVGLASAEAARWFEARERDAGRARA